MYEPSMVGKWLLGSGLLGAHYRLLALKEIAPAVVRVAIVVNGLITSSVMGMFLY